MTCTHHDKLLDLALGEIKEPAASALRAEAQMCPHCGESLRQLQLGAALAARLPLEEPPSSMDAVILAAARARASEFAIAAAQSALEPGRVGAVRAGFDEPPKIGHAVESAIEPAASVAEPPGFLERAREWFQGVALGPQLAMASVMALVVSIGLWSLPTVAPIDTVARTRVSPDPEGEAFTELPRSVNSPQDDRAHQADVALNIGEARGAREQAQAPAAYGAANRGAANESGARDGAFSAGNPKPAAGRDDAYEGDDSELAAPVRQRSERARAPAQRIESGGSGGGAPTAGATMQSASTNSRVARRARTASTNSRVARRTRTPRPAVEGRLGSTTAPTAPAASASDDAQGVRAYRGGDYAEAEDAPEDVLAGETQLEVPRGNAVHQLARSQRQANACREALGTYRDLFQRFPSYAQTPQALVEAADCQRRVGSLREARRLLEQARRFSTTEAVAIRELRRIETLERASRRSAVKTAEPASVETY